MEFVGRVEVLSPWMVQRISDANQHQDLVVLKKFGRFLEPFAAQMHVTGSPAIEHVKRDLSR